MKGLTVLLAVLLAASAFGATLVLQPGPADGKDSMISATNPTRNYGTWPNLMVNYGPAYEVRGLVEFDLGVLSGATINSAKFDLWISNPNQTNYNFGVYRVTATWQEMSVTWNNQPAHNAAAYDVKMISGAVGGPYTWDVKKLVQEWASKTYPNYGLMVKRVNMQNPTNWPYFCSSDHSNTSYRPRLTVDYSGVGIAPASFGEVKALFK
ncbi:MAG: DNRLRE domain-containing protein [candidate division Zixibacteria bacterium]|nr:DNRLRE domain-containing protein [candidate division Zixibacteria bacterium]